MKRISFLLVTFALCGAPVVRGQDAATAEQLNKLSGQVETLLETQQALSKRIDALAKEVESLREQAGKPTGDFAAKDRVDALAKALQEVDHKRIQDAENTKTELDKVRNAVLGSLKDPAPKSGKKKGQTPPDEPPVTAEKQDGFEHKIQSGDTLSGIVQAYREQKKIKLTIDDVLKANPGLKADRLVPGKTIFIPAPKPS